MTITRSKFLKNQQIVILFRRAQINTSSRNSQISNTVREEGKVMMKSYLQILKKSRFAKVKYHPSLPSLNPGQYPFLSVLGNPLLSSLAVSLYQPVSLSSHYDVWMCLKLTIDF